MTAEALVEKIIPIVRSAGEILLSSCLHKDEVYKKSGEANFVTEFDMRIQRFLMNEIVELVPNASFFGEENTEGNKQEISDSGYTFFIDPIDGTTNFLFGYHHSCISVGIALRGKLVGGIVYNPYTDQMYSAVRGQGSYCNGRRLTIEDRRLSEGIAAFGCARYNEGSTRLLFDTVEVLFHKSLSIRNGGSAAIDLCRISTGSNVIYLEMFLQPYDYAAASVILTEAGGVIAQVDGSEITLHTGCSVLAGTKKAVEECRAVINMCAEKLK